MIELVVGNSLNKVFQNVVAKIENSSSFDLENFVIVPDRLSLFAEKEIFSILNLTSSFNIKVLGISKLQNYFAPQIETLSGDESRLIVYSILEEKNFEFLKPSFEIATEIFNIISQLKSSNISAEEFLEKAETQKLQEIGSIFEIYEERKTKADQSDILNNIANNLDLEKISKFNFFICGFDNLTAQAFKVVEKILKFGKKVVVGATLPENQRNSKVYDNDIFQKVVRFSKENKIDVLKTYINSKQQTQATHVLTNLFSYSPKQLETNCVRLLEFETPEVEIAEIAKTICFYVKNKNFRFSNFNVLSGNLESFGNDFASIFETYDIPYYIDLGQKIETLPIYSFFKNLFEFIEITSEQSLFEFLINPYVNLNKGEVSLFKNEIDFNGNFSFELGSKFENVNEILERIKKHKEKLLKGSCLSEFSQIIVEIVKDFSLEQNNEKIISKLANDLRTQKIYMQVFKKLESVLEGLKGEEKFSFENFSILFLKLFGEKEIKGVPLSVDCVFVGGENSFFEERKVMFVSNAVYGTLPKISKDLGLFSDEDIAGLALDIQPTIRMINRRNKQKLLFNLSQGEELFVSTSGSELGEKTQKSTLFFELQKIFTFKNKPIQILNDFYSFLLDEEKYLEFKIQTHQDFNREVVKFKGQISNEEIEKLIGKKFEQQEKISCAKEMFKRFSPTEIEKFFQCPFKHFFYYGIRIKENQVNKFDARDFGNYFHIMAENFVKRNLGKVGELSDEEIKKELQQIEKIVEQEPRFQMLLKNINNVNMFALLKKEANILLENIRNEQKFSNFVATFFEQFFEFKTPLSKIVGVVDRIDVYEKMFRVVDYKTGEVKKSLRAVFEGLELQLFIYLLAVSEKLGLEPAGAFYYSIGTDYNKEKTSKNKMEGFVVGEQRVIKGLDKRFGTKKESDIVSLKLTSGSSLDNLVLSTKKNVLTKEGLLAILEYVKLLIEKAEKEIFSGKIPAKPLGEDACLNCPLFSICSFKQNTFEKERKIGKEIQETEFIRIVENGKN